MITRMTVENFKALKRVQVDLAPFTVLIGRNDTGKSSFLEAVFALAESIRGELRNSFWSPWSNSELVHGRDAERVISLTAVGTPERRRGTSEQVATYSLDFAFGNQNCSLKRESANVPSIWRGEIETNKNKSQSAASAYRNSKGDSSHEKVARYIANCLPAPAITRWDIEELAQPSRLPPERRLPFDPSGYGLATCIAEMKLGTGGHFDALRADFCKRFPAFTDIIVQRATVTGVERDDRFQKRLGSGGEGYALVLVRKDGVEIPAANASGGALVTLAFLTLIHLREPRKLLLIEEPENGLHPSRLKEIVELLRGMVESRNDCQVILTTHSPLLLDYVQPEEVRVFLRNDQDDVEVHNLANVPGIRERLNYLMLGELVYNEGEQELVKEIKQHATADSGRGHD